MRRRSVVLALLAVAMTISGVSPAFGQQDGEAPETPVPNWFECAQGLAFPGPSGEIYGPTAINAQSANQRLAVALDEHGTVTVFRWPHPSFYDQVKYRTSTRDAERLGALPNEGAFLGLAVTTGDGAEPTTRTVWLRDLPATMTHPDERSDLVETVYTTDGSAHENLGLTVTVRDVVAHDADVLSREVTVAQDGDSPVTAARVIAFENFNLVVSKYPYFPVQDWCFEEQNTDRATYDPALDAVVHTKQGPDESTGEQVSVAVGMAFDRPSTGHQVGGDAYEGSALPAGRVPGPTQDAYDDAADGTLTGGGDYVGQTTGALATDLDLDGGSDTVTLHLGAAETHAGVGEVLNTARDRALDTVARAKAGWFAELLSEAPLPATDDEAVLALANRALVTLVSVYDPTSGAIVASIATQSPYGEDWPRDGAFFNHALDLIGQHDWAATRARWYADLQAKGQDTGSDNPTELNPFVESSQAAFVPPGNWAMNYYADGVVGGPIPWEIDETGYTLWLFWDHYAATEDRETLAAVYPAIRRAADFLVECTDPTNGLQCSAIEDDNPQPRQSIHGAGPVWLGLDSAVKAAEVLGETADAERWRARREELRGAIDTELYADGSYGDGNPVIVWPVCFQPFDHERFADGQYRAIWESIAPTFEEPQPGEPQAGLYESKGLVSLAKATKGRPEWTARVRRGLEWIATEHAEPGTHIMGEEWFNQDGEVISTVSQPHVWEQILFYLAAIEAYPPQDLGGAEHRTCRGTIGALRGDVAPAAGDGDGDGDDGDGDDAAPAPDDGEAALPATGGGLLTAALGTAFLAAATVLRRRRG